MAEYAGCQCCGNVCCSVESHPKVPADGTIIAVPSIFPEDYPNSWSVYEWTTVFDWESWIGRKWGLSAYTVVAGENCNCTYEARLKFTDLCYRESPSDPRNCGTCYEESGWSTGSSSSDDGSHGAVHYLSLAGGSISAGCDLSIAERAAGYWGFGCHFYKVEFQVAVKWSCDAWRTSPEGFIKCTDSRVILPQSVSFTVPHNAGLGWRDTQRFTFDIKPRCGNTCAPYYIPIAVNVSGDTLGVGVPFIVFALYADTTSVFDCFLSGGNRYNWQSPWVADPIPESHFFCNPCSGGPPYCGMWDWEYFYVIDCAVECNLPGGNCGSVPEYAFPKSFTFNMYFSIDCCEPGPISMTFKVCAYTSLGVECHPADCIPY